MKMKTKAEKLFNHRQVLAMLVMAFCIFFAKANASASSWYKPCEPNPGQTKMTAVEMRQSHNVLRYTSLRRGSKIVSIKAKVKFRFFKMKYSLYSCPRGASSYIRISDNGRVTFRRGAPRGTYQIKVGIKQFSRCGFLTKKVRIVVR